MKIRKAMDTEVEKYKDAKGTLSLSYAIAGDSSTGQMTKSYEFKGHTEQAAMVFSNGQRLVLSSLAIQYKRDNVLSLNGDQLAEYSLTPRTTLNVSIIITKRGNVAPEITITKSTSSLPEGEYPPFTSIHKFFDDANEILTCDDTEEMAIVLDSIASPTFEYHDEITKLVVSAKTIDFAHLQLVANSVYFTHEDFLSITKRMKEIQESAEIDHEELDRLRDAYYMAREHCQFIDGVIQLGVEKMDNLQFEEATALLSLIYPTFEADSTFNAVFKKFDSFTQEELLILLSVANSKAAESTAANIATELFEKHSDGSFAAAIELAKLLKPERAASLFFIAISKGFESFSFSQVHAMTEIVNKNRRASFLVTIKDKVPSLKYSEFKELARLSKSGSLKDLAGDYFVKVSDFSAAKAVDYSKMVSGHDKDKVLATAISLFKSITSEELVLVAKAAYASKKNLVVDSIQKVSDLNTANAVLLSSTVSGYDKDKVIKAALPLLTDLNAANLILIKKASYSAGAKLVIQNLSQIPDFTVENAVLIAQEMSGYDKNKVIDAKLLQPVTFTTAEILNLARAKYSDKGKAILKHLNKISDFQQLSNINILSNAMSGYEKNKIVDAYKANASQLETDEILTLASYRYSGKEDFVHQNLAMISDLDLSNVERLSKSLSGYNRNKVVDFFNDRNAELTTDGLVRLTNARYSRRQEFLIANTNKLKDLSVTASIDIASMLSGYDKDKFLLKAVWIVTDLTTGNLNNLASAAYNKKEQILEEGVRRLSAQ
jgi:hypothetical protein